MRNGEINDYAKAYEFVSRAAQESGYNIDGIIPDSDVLDEVSSIFNDLFTAQESEILGPMNHGGEDVEGSFFRSRMISIPDLPVLEIEHSHEVDEGNAEDYYCVRLANQSTRLVTEEPENSAVNIAVIRSYPANSSQGYIQDSLETMRVLHSELFGHTS